MIQVASLEQYPSSRIPQARTIFYYFTWETLELHLLENLRQTCFSKVVPGKAGRVWGSGSRNLAEHRRADVPPAATKGKLHLAPLFPTFSKENQSFCKAFGKYRYSPKAGTAQQIAWVESLCDYFDTDSGITVRCKWPCRLIALGLNSGTSRFPPAKREHT